MEEKKEKESYEIDYTDRFMEDVTLHKKAGSKSILLKIHALINELRESPYIGTGNPEPLKGNLKGKWSRRITQKHRLIYQVDDNKITVLLISAKGHYDDK